MADIVEEARAAAVAMDDDIIEAQVLAYYGKLNASGEDVLGNIRMIYWGERCDDSIDRYEVQQFLTVNRKDEGGVIVTADFVSVGWANGAQEARMIFKILAGD